MALTRDFKETVMKRARAEPDFRRALFNEAVSLFLNGEPDVARAMLRDLINATIGFEKLAAKIETPSKSLHRMLSAHGNPTMNSLSVILAALKHIVETQKTKHSVVLQAKKKTPTKLVSRAKVH